MLLTVKHPENRPCLESFSSTSVRRHSVCVEFLDAGSPGRVSPLGSGRAPAPGNGERQQSFFFRHCNQCCLFSGKIKEKGSESLIFCCSYLFLWINEMLSKSVRTFYASNGPIHLQKAGGRKGCTLSV